MVAWYTGLVILGSQLIFLLFNFFWNWQEWNLEAYGLIMKEFPLMMILPLSFYLALKAISKPKTTEGDYLLFQSENGKDQLKVRLQDFMYANTSENYITIFYISNNSGKHHLIRKPLKVLEQELMAHPEIQRSHRSYLVNTRNIQAVKQLKGKVQIEINGANVPVSKQFQKHFLT
ncbi:LytR/AlgR family response regulator transcription factor [Cyclobacterium jeungdonense]|uniref:LytTR family DNA-binding domain-containing protein n=1 Tax=Cyclobacterium jeungdonense TaxID=708087 RepID=A0ABT8CBN5_9BACT|nr:LytTR family DNA-binding domain-containing protein [Cyclobacterium jeungdonense]MDN3689208.1 LytTR family DNA-binding domain-containing protein [Cyclobacterium jeungdonense]